MVTFFYLLLIPGVMRVLLPCAWKWSSPSAVRSIQRFGLHLLLGTEQSINSLCSTHRMDGGGE
jgi:hypothetical protein